MDMEVMRPPPPSSTDLTYDTACSTPYTTATSSPQRYAAFYYSAPASPTHISASYHAGAVPSSWESQISTATSSNYGDAEDHLQETDFAFDFSGQLERTTSTADELFDGGKIKPLTPPPELQYDQKNPPDSPKNLIEEAFSPRKERVHENGNENRGRERTSNSSNASSSRNKKGTRSLSPYRVSDLLIDPELNQEPANNNSPVSNSSAFSSFWYKKWKIKDLLLFRSASESRATDDDQLKKYALLKKNRDQDEKKSTSFRSTTESVGSVSRRRSGPPPVSPHELHYTMNRAASEEMKKRTYLPYKQGLLGCLGFHPNGFEISRRFESSSGGSVSRR